MNNKDFQNGFVLGMASGGAVRVGGSGVELVTEFEGIDINYDEGQIYNANAVNQVLTIYAELLNGLIDEVEELKRALSGASMTQTVQEQGGESDG